MSLTLKQIRYFVAAAETGQVSHAAMEMNISQSSVTSAVQSLENQLGVRLFERGHSGVTLTIEGARFLNHARTIMAAVDDAVRSPLGTERKESGTLRVATTYTVAGYYMPRYYARFRSNYPLITLEMHEVARDRIESGLLEGEYDIAVMLVSNIANSAEIAHETLVSSQRRLWLPTDHRLCDAKQISLQDVAREPYVMLTVDEAKQTAGRYWDHAGVVPNVIFSTSSVEAVRSMVAGGMGVTILSDMVYRPWSLEGRRLEVRTLSDEVPSMDVGLAWSRAEPLKPVAEVFRSFMTMATGGGGE
ncbi:LysR family transcriptional regulator [Sedimentimonas flavescens]|uniref:LysR family transcriptional regulator n=1 Tax=Sedimentimonas flavescens TaxID=2851012 RepID=UPI001C4A2AAC|nr:LysR family transcriptional regulator [Sedimentimonas flavescens]MBW0156617.1 LysR family transcriptional regulator [Sedimentimonas flavescens]